MLKRYKLHEQADGTVNIGPGLEDEPCARCGAESFAQPCPGDGGDHYHGRVHTKRGGLEAVCHECWKQVYDEWNDGPESLKELIRF